MRRVWKKSSTTISTEWTKVRYFTFEKGLKALGMLICPIKRDWIRYNIRKYIFIGYNSRIRLQFLQSKSNENVIIKRFSKFNEK